MQVGYGVKARAMGGVGLARPLDVFVIASNPAGMMALDDRFDIGVQWVRQDGQYRFVADVTPGGQPRLLFANKDRMSSHMVWPEAGILQRWNRLAAGVSFYSFGGWNVHYQRANPFFGRAPLACQSEANFVSPALAVRVNSTHSLGVSLNLAYAFFRVRGLSLSDERSASGERNDKKDYTYGASVRIGWFAQPLTCLWLGISYQTPTWMGSFSRYKAVLPHGGAMRLPSQLAAGLTWHFHPLLTGSVDVIEVFWRDAPLFRNTRDEGGSFGSDSGPGLGWRGQVAFKLGLSWEIMNHMTLRAGYCHAGVPMLPASTFLNILTQETIKDTVTAGFTLHFSGNEFSFSYMRGLGHHWTGDTNVILNPTTDVPFLITPVRLRSRQDAFGFSYGRRF